MNFLITVILWLIIASGGSVFAQKNNTNLHQITGKINASNKNIYIEIVDSNNKTLSHPYIVSDDGSFLISNLQYGEYTLIFKEGSAVLEKRKIFIDGNIDDLLIDIKTDSTIVSTINSKKNLNDIEEIVITKKKNTSLIQREEGKTIYNLSNSISGTSGTALEALEKAAGVSVDATENISFRGKSEVLVQINGKNSPLKGAELSNYLKSIPSNSIDKIEFVTNPSSKYDASGSTIINLILKQGKSKGTNGSASLSVGSGEFIKNNNSIVLNHKNEKTNYFFNYNFGYREAFININTDRSYYNPQNILDKNILQENYMKFHMRTHNTKLGLDHNFNSKHKIGFSLDYNLNSYDSFGNNNSKTFDGNKSMSEQNWTSSLAKIRNKNYNFNGNYTHVLDTLKSTFTVDLDVMKFPTNNNQFFTINSDNYVSNNRTNSKLAGYTNGDIDIYSIKSDLVKILSNNWKLETGIKSSFVESDQKTDFYDTSTGLEILDKFRSNHYNYKENINAIYGSINKRWDNWSTTLGLRLENTNITGNQLSTKEVNKKSYTELFPSFLLAYTPNKTHHFEFNYSRRLTRPNYEQLNPFMHYVDPNTSKTGNPDVNPQTSQSFEFTYGFKSKYYATLAYSKTKDNITYILKPIILNGNNITTQTVENMDNVEFWSFNLGVPIAIFKWWNANLNLTLFKSSFTGNLSDTPIENQQNFAFHFNTSNTFNFGNGYSAEFSTQYKAKERYAYSSYEPYFQMNIGAQKRFNNQHTLSFNISDVFWTSKHRLETNFSNYNEKFINKRDTRTAMLTYTYTFGGGKIQTQKSNSANDLKDRAKS